MVIIYTVFAGLQWYELSSQRRQAEQIFNTSKRPWIAIDESDAHPIGVLDIEPDPDPKWCSGFHFNLNYLIKNSGSSPAMVQIEAFKVRDGRVSPEEWQRLVDTTCSEKSTPDRFPFTVVPGTKRVPYMSCLEVSGSMQQKKMIEPTIIGCIWYRSTTGDVQTIHRTAFMVDIGYEVADDPIPFPKIPPPDTIKTASTIFGKAD